MSRYQSFEELKIKSKEFVQSSKERGAYNGLRKLLTELYPDKAHFIYELLQNAEDKEASSVAFELFNDRLVFTHNGKKRDFILDDIDSITNIGTSTKIDDPTAIGKFGVGFKAVYSYTNTPEIHSGEYDFKIVDMLVPEDEGVFKTASVGKTQFVFPFDHDTKTPKQAVKEITEGLLALNENSILFLKNIHQITVRLPDGKVGGIKLEDKDDVLKKIIWVNALTKGKENTFWYKFSKPCVIESNNEYKNYNVDIAYKLKKIEVDGEKQYKIDADLKGNVCIFFPAVKENSHLRFHINAPFASTVARDSVRDCSENKQLIREIANLCVCSLYFLKEKHCIDLGLYAALPNRRDFIDATSAYYPIYSSILSAFKTQDFIVTACGDYKRINEVLQTNREKNFYHHIAKYRANGSRNIEQIDSTAAYWLRRIAWIPNKDGIFCRPCDVTADNLYNGFEFDENAIFLKNIGFGDKTKAPNDIVALLKKAGVKMSSTDEMFLNASEEEKQEFLKFLESKRSRKNETLNLSEALEAENKDQLPYEEDDDYGRDISIKNVTKRQQKQQQEFEEGLTVEPSRKQVWHYTYLSTNGKLEKQFISEQYHGKCQICGRSAIRKFNGQPYFEAINVINTANLDPKYQSSLDAGWNTLCLCPNCAAEYRYCAKDLSDLETQVENTQIENRKNEYIEIYITLNCVRTKIMFTPRHFLALQTAFRVFKAHENDE